MPYAITTRDGITIQNIPDNVPPDAQELRDRVSAIRAGQVGAGEERQPAAASLGMLQQAGQFVTGLPGAIREAATGEQRRVAGTEALPEWTTMPELNALSMASARTGIGTLLAQPAEAVQIIQSNFPGVQVWQDEAGNFIMRSSVDGQEYAIKPGFRVSDIPRAIGGLAAFTPAGRAATIPSAAIRTGATQAAIEASQAAVGGTIDPVEIAVATALGGGAQAAIQGASMAAQAARRAMAPRPVALRVEPTFGVPEVPPTPPIQRAGIAEEILPPPGAAPVAAVAPEAPPITAPVTATAEEMAPQVRAAVAAIPEAPPARPTAAAMPEAPPAAGAEIPRPTSPAAVAASDVVGAADDAARAATGGTTGAADQMSPEQIAELIRRASSGGMGSSRATRQLADIAKVNTAVRDEAQRLGFELPIDVFSDNARFVRTVGLIRSAAGSEAEALWINTLRQAADRADDLIRTLDATTDVAAVSDRVKTSLMTEQRRLKADADRLRGQVDQQIEKAQVAETASIRDYLNRTITELGGPERGRAALTPQEKKLFDAVQGGDMTYARLVRERQAIGDALEGKQSTYSDVGAGVLKQLYRALADDQIAHIAKVGGEPLADTMRASNSIYKKMFDLQDRIVGAFGKDTEGSIAALMRRSIQAGAKGDIRPLKELLKTVSPELRRETVATALADFVRGRAGVTRGQFGFSEYAKAYRDLRRNAPVYNEIVKALGPGADDLLTKLYQISSRVSNARDSVIQTGKANQLILQQMRAESLTNQVLNSVTGRVATSAAGAVFGGPIGAGLGAALASTLARGGKDRVKAAADLLGSEEFIKAAEHAATKKVP